MSVLFWVECECHSIHTPNRLNMQITYFLAFLLWLKKEISPVVNSQVTLIVVYSIFSKGGFMVLIKIITAFGLNMRLDFDLNNSVGLEMPAWVSV